MIIHTDDAFYFGSSDKVEKEFVDKLADRFNLEDQGHAHWYLSHRIYREKDGSYIMDQEQYTKHLLKKFFQKMRHGDLQYIEIHQHLSTTYSQKIIGQMKMRKQKLLNDIPT